MPEQAHDVFKLSSEDHFGIVHGKIKARYLSELLFNDEVTKLLASNDVSNPKPLARIINKRRDDFNRCASKSKINYQDFIYLYTDTLRDIERYYKQQSYVDKWQTRSDVYSRQNTIRWSFLDSQRHSSSTDEKDSSQRSVVLSELERTIYLGLFESNNGILEQMERWYEHAITPRNLKGGAYTVEGGSAKSTLRLKAKNSMSTWGVNQFNEKFARFASVFLPNYYPMIEHASIPSIRRYKYFADSKDKDTPTEIRMGMQAFVDSNGNTHTNYLFHAYALAKLNTSTKSKQSSKIHKRHMYFILSKSDAERLQGDTSPGRFALNVLGTILSIIFTPILNLSRTFIFLGYATYFQRAFHLAQAGNAFINIFSPLFHWNTGKNIITSILSPKDQERRREGKFTKRLLGMEENAPALRMVVLPADDKHILHQKKTDIDISQEYKEDDVNNPGALLDKVLEDIHKGENDFYLSEQVKLELIAWSKEFATTDYPEPAKRVIQRSLTQYSSADFFQDTQSDKQKISEQFAKVISRLFYQSCKDLNISMVAKEITPLQRQALYFHFIKYRLTDALIQSSQADSYNFTCKDGIDRGGVHSLYYHHNKSIEQNSPLGDKEILRGLHAAPLHVKGRPMNDHDNLYWNAVAFRIEGLMKQFDDDCTSLEKSGINELTAQQLKTRLDVIKKLRETRDLADREYLRVNKHLISANQMNQRIHDLENKLNKLCQPSSDSIIDAKPAIVHSRKTSSMIESTAAKINNYLPKQFDKISLKPVLAERKSTGTLNLVLSEQKMMQDNVKMAEVNCFNITDQKGQDTSVELHISDQGHEVYADERRDIALAFHVFVANSVASQNVKNPTVKLFITTTHFDLHKDILCRLCKQSKFTIELHTVSPDGSSHAIEFHERNIPNMPKMPKSAPKRSH